MASTSVAYLRLLFGVLILAPRIGALPLPAAPLKHWCTDSTVPFADCAKGGKGARMMEEILHIPVPIPHWWESFNAYVPTTNCTGCTVIWLLCPAEDTGAWDGGSALRLGSRIMLEKINGQQWLLPGYELMCEYYNNNCHAKTAQKIVQGRSSLYATKYVGVGSTGCSGVSNTLSSYTWTYNMPIMSWASGAPDLSVRPVHRNFFRAVIPHTAFTFAWIQVYLACGWQKIVVIMAQEARFRGHFEMHKTETKAAGCTIAFQAQILQPLQQTDDLFKTIKNQRYRIIQAVTFEDTWRAMMCSAYSQGIRDLIWLVFGVYSKGWYITLDNPPLAKWNCITKDMRMMANNAIYAMTMMWSLKMEVPLYCDRDRVWTPTKYKEIFVERMNAELKNPADVVARGGHAPKLGYGPAPADGICLYAQTLATLLGTHPDPAKRKTHDNKNYNLTQLTGRSDDVYEQINTLLQAADYNGIGPSPLSFKCGAMPTNGICNDACRNSAKCTGDLNGPTEVYQFYKDGTVGDFDSYHLTTSEFPMRQLYDSGIQAKATTKAEKLKAFTWYTPFKFTYGSYWGASADTTAPASIYAGTAPDLTAPTGDNGETCMLGYHAIPTTTMCVPDDQIPEVQQSSCLKYTYFDLTVKQCFGCPAGKMQLESGKTACDRCAKGYFSNTTLDECLPCPKGMLADSEGSDICKNCMAGMFAEVVGQSECKRCATGKISIKAGSSGCDSCQNHLPRSSTLFIGAASIKDCICMVGKYDANLLLSQNQCVDCKEGFDCSVAGLLQPRQAKGYFVKNFGVFLCEPPGSCIGANWSQSVCRPPRSGFMCMDCPDGESVNTVLKEDSALGCSKCGFITSAAIAIVPLIVLVIAVVVIYFTRKSPLDENPIVIEIQNTIGILVVFLQVVNLMWATRMLYGDPLNDVMEGLVKHLDPDHTFRSGPCLSPGMSAPTAQYALTIISPIIGMVVLALVYFVGLCGGGLFLADGVFNIVGEVLVEFYISITLAIFAPFNCFKHPNLDMSVQKYPQIICGDSKHGTLMGLAVVGILFYSVTTIVVSLFMTWKYPQSMLKNDVRHLLRCEFLFRRFIPQRYWFCNVTILRNFFIAVFASVLPEKELDVSILLIEITLIASMMVFLWFRPRLTLATNRLDAFVQIIQILFLTFGVTSVDGTPLKDGLSLICVLIFFLALITILAWISYKGIRLVTKTFGHAIYLSHHAGAGGAAARVFHCILLNTLNGSVFSEIDNLGYVGAMIDAVKMSNNLLVAFGSETLCRSWCIGAITCAHRKGVPMHSVIFTNPTVSETVCALSESDGGYRKIFTGKAVDKSRAATFEIDTLSLRGYGVGQEEVHPAIRALTSVDPVFINLHSQTKVNTDAEELLGRMTGLQLKCKVDVATEGFFSGFKRLAQYKEGTGFGDKLCLILSDHLDGDSVAVSRLFQSVFIKKGNWLEDQDFPPQVYAATMRSGKVDAAVFMFGRTTHNSAPQLARLGLLHKCNPNVHVCPVVVGVTFDFPDEDFLTNLEMGKALSLGTNAAQRLASLAGDEVSLKNCTEGLIHVLSFFVTFVNVPALMQAQLNKSMNEVFTRAHNGNGRRTSITHVETKAPGQGS